MRKSVIVMLFLACGCRCQAAEDAFGAAHAAMRKELGSEFIVERTGIFIVGGDLPRSRFDRFKKRTIEDCSKALWCDFFSKRPEYPIRIYLFQGKTSYETWVKKLAGFEPRSPYGFYLPGRKAMMMNIATGGGTLVHEMTHALTAPDFPDCPTWLFEGLGSLFEQCYVTRDGHIRGAVNWRLPVLRRGGITPLKKLVTMSDAEFRGKKESLNYANARYLCFYLQQRGLLTRFYKTFRAARRAGTDTTGWASLGATIGQPAGSFETQWHAWLKTLRWPPK